MLGNAAVRYDAASTTPERLVAAIRATGYGAELPASTASPLDAQLALDGEQRHEFAALRTQGGLCTRRGSGRDDRFGPADDGRWRRQPTSIDPLMRSLMTRIAPAMQHVVPWLFAIPRPAITWSLLVLSAIVMGWAGRHFYVRAWKALRHRAADMNTLIAVGTGAAFGYSVFATVAPARIHARGLAPDVYYEAVILIIAFILVGQHAGGARQAADRVRPAGAGRPAAAHRPGGARRRRHRRADRVGAVAATKCWCVRASAFRSMVP